MIALQENEHVIATVRKHWFLLLPRILGIFILFILPFLAYYALLQFDQSLAMKFSASLPTPFLVFFSSAWALITWTQFFAVWTDHYLDAWIITNERIIDIDQRGFFHRRVGSFRLERVQDITIEVTGFIPTLLNFGTIHVQTAGEEQEFTIRGIPNPQHIKHIVLAHISATVQNTAQSSRPSAAI